MQLLLTVIAALIGGWLADWDRHLLGLGAGAAVGYLAARLRAMQLQLERLESARRTPQAPATPPVRGPAPGPGALPAGRTAAVDPAARRRAAANAPAVRDSALARLPAQAWRVAKHWLTSGNVPVKLGVIVCFFGVAFLLRYALDRQLLAVPLQFRLLAVAAGAAVLLGIGWRLRFRNAPYALSLQGGGIGILYLTIFAAFRLYALLPPTAAFVLLLMLTGAVGVLAVLQNTRTLAILATVGGFLAPLLTSTGEGSHVALFSYYLVLNAAILGISWYRAWRSLNLIGFAFTFAVGALWGYDYYRPALYASTQPFLVLYFLFYQAIAVLFAQRRPPNLGGIVDGTIVFGTPVIAFALQSRLVDDTEYGLAISAAAVAVFYVLLAGWLYRRRRDTLRLMVDSYGALAIAFATVAIPLALDARWTAAAWALEGAALVWIGVRQQGRLARLSGSALLFASGVAFANDGWHHNAGIALLNGNAMGGILISAAAVFAARCLHRDERPHRGQRAVSVALLLWGIAWWLGTGVMEIDDRVAFGSEMHAITLFAAVSAAVLTWLAARLEWRAARHATLAYLPLLSLYGVLYLVEQGHLFGGAGALAWLFAGGAHFIVLRAYGDGSTRREALWHTAGAVLLLAALAQEAYWRLDQAALSEVWSGSAALLVIAVLAFAIMRLRERLPWPLQQCQRAYLAAAGGMLAFVLVVLANAGIERSGDPAPLVYLPLFNPFDVASAAALTIAFHFLRVARAAGGFMTAYQWRNGMVFWLLAAFVLSTIAVVRGVHHLGGVPWSDRTLLRSVSVQAALSIYWGLLGFAGMLAGARRHQRLVWVTGTGLMALVVVKLFLVDLGNTATVARIVSFLGVGGLLLVIGYFAPAPPRDTAARTEV